MTATVQIIPAFNLALAFVPVIAVFWLLYYWSLDFANAIYSMVRMLIQLLLVGYLLATIFESESGWLVLAVLIVMVTAASWIALGTVKSQRIQLYKYTFYSIVLGGGFTLALVTQSVITLEPWFEPKYMIPLAGMIFANTMNSISLAAERLHAERARDVPYEKARNMAFQAAFIPVINSMFAVGLVALPGMMTGQILSGVSPVIAAHYQIVVMCMIFGSAGLSTALFLKMAKPLLD